MFCFIWTFNLRIKIASAFEELLFLRRFEIILLPNPKFG